jgi:formyl-CoA transferase
MTDTSGSTALQSITVLDLTRVRSGPTCVRELGDWGAKVIKIEMPEEGGSATQTDFSARHEADFQNLHRNKRSMTLNLKTPQGLAILRRMVEKADVVVENYRPDVKHRLGIDYESLSKINPRIVYASISGFGQDGPYRERPGVDQIAQGMSGLMSVTGEPGRGPMRAGTALADLSAGIFAAMGIFVALFERERSGRGQWVQTSLLQAQIFMLDFQAARSDVRRDRRPGRQQSSDRRADRRVQDQGRLRQSRADAGDVAPLLQGDRAPGLDRASRLRNAEGAPRASRRTQ